MASSAVDADVAVSDDTVVLVADVVGDDGQVLGEVEPVRLGEIRVGQFSPAGGGDDVVDEAAAGVAVGWQARWADEFWKSRQFVVWSYSGFTEIPIIRKSVSLKYV